MRFEIPPDAAGGLPDMSVGGQAAPDVPLGEAAPAATDAAAPDITRPADGLPAEEGTGGDQLDITRPAAAQEGSSVPGDANGNAEHTTEAAAEDGRPEDDTPADSIGGGAPPDVPATGETDLPGPDRGLSLQRVCDYAAVSAEEVHDTLVDTLMARPLGQTMLDHMMQEEGRTLDEAVREISRTESDEGTLAGMAVEAETTLAQAQYHDDLEAAGLSLRPEPDRVGLSITSTEAFTAALTSVGIPEDSEAHERLVGQTAAVTRIALDTASAVLIINDALTLAREVAGDTAGALLDRTAEHLNSIPVTEIEAAGRLPEHARDISTQLTRLDAPDPAVYAVRQLALARQEGLVDSWAVGHGPLRLIGHSDMTLGVDRYRSAESWEQTYRYLEHLQRTAPDSQFIAEVASTITEDLRAALAGQDNAPPLPGRGVTEAMQSQWRARRQERLAEARPQLEEALRRVSQITGWQWQ
jgi:hypothetical protein